MGGDNGRRPLEDATLVVNEGRGGQNISGGRGALACPRKLREAQMPPVLQKKCRLVEAEGQIGEQRPDYD